MSEVSARRPQRPAPPVVGAPTCPPWLSDHVARSRATQGLPPTVTDPDALAKVASLFGLAAPDRNREHRMNKTDRKAS